MTSYSRPNGATAEENEKSHHELLEAVFQYMPAAINIIRGSDLRLIIANPGYRAIAPGKGDPVGKTLDELWPETGHDFAALCRQVLETGEPFHAVDQLNFIHRAPNGPLEKAWFTWSLYRIRLPGDEGWGIFNPAWETTSRKHAEDAIRISGESFRKLVELAPFGIYAVDADFRLTMISAGAQRVFQNVHPLLGRDFDEVLRIVWPEPFVSEALHHFRQVLATGVPYRSPGTVERRADINEAEAYDWKLERVVLPDGRPGVVCYFYDLSERQRYEESLRIARNRLETAIDASHIVLFHQDRQLRYTWVHNPTLGYRAQEILGKSDQELFQRASDAKHLEDIKRAVIESGIGRREEVHINHDGESRYYDLVVQPDVDASGLIQGINCAAVDVTRRKLAEAALKENDRRKDEFLATLSHELRNPLATIQSGLEVIELKPDNPQVVQQATSMMKRQLGHLVALVDDLLEVSRISQGKLKLRREVVSIAQAIQAAVETCQPLLGEAGHHLRLELPDQIIQVTGDPHRLAQLFANLLNNAAKYTPRSGRIEVSVQLEDTHVVVTITDSGIGLESEQLNRIFEMFTQVENQSSSYAGLGIGLSLVKSLVEMHGGTIRAHSEGRGLGASFFVRLPITSDEEESIPRQTVVPQTECGRKRVLVVDDNLSASKLLAMVIEQFGHEVAIAANGQEALDRGRQFQPDLVLMDIGMPVMDGYTAARLMRGEPWGKEIMLVALTGWGQENDKQESLDAGFDQHLIKPVGGDVLRQVFLQCAARP